MTVLFRKAYVGLKSIYCMTSLAGLEVSQVASQSEGPGVKKLIVLLIKLS